MTDFRKKKSQMSNFIKIRLVGAKLFHTDGRTDGRTDMKKLTIAFAILRTRLKMLQQIYWGQSVNIYTRYCTRHLHPAQRKFS